MKQSRNLNMTTGNPSRLLAIFALPMLIGILAVPMLFIFPLLSPVIVALAVMMYFKASKGVADKIKEKRRHIEYELPRFVSHIEKTLKLSLIHISEPTRP